MEHANGELSDKDYKEQLKKTIDDANERWAKQKEEGKFNQAEHDNAVEKIKDMTEALPPGERLDVLQKEYQRNILKSDEYDKALVKDFYDFKSQNPTAEEKKAFAAKFRDLVKNLPEDRQEEIRRICL